MPSTHMIPFDEFKKLLGPFGENLSDEDILKIRDWEYRLADLVFDSWLRERNDPDGDKDRLTP